MPKKYWEEEMSQIFETMIRDVDFGNSKLGKRLSYCLKEINKPEITTKLMTYFTEQLSLIGTAIMTADDGDITTQEALDYLKDGRAEMYESVKQFGVMNTSLDERVNQTVPFLTNGLRTILAERYENGIEIVNLIEEKLCLGK
jgi:hypothetical protein